MIYDTAKNLKLYTEINPAFGIVADYLEKNDLKAVECGSYPVADGITANISEYTPEAGGDYEAHRDYIDLQLAITGEEYIDVLPLENALNSTGYKPDVEFFTEQNAKETRVALNEGTFVYLAPGDTHKPCIKAGSEKIKKAVFKIKI